MTRRRTCSNLGKTKKKTITLPEPLIIKAERIAEHNLISFNDLMGRLLTQYLEGK